LKKGFFKKIIFWGVGLPALVISILFVVFSVKVIEKFGIGNPVPPTGNVTMAEKLKSKIFYDRANWWKCNIEYIFEPPYFLKPSGRPFILQHVFRGDIDFKAGAHNALLHSIRTNGWYSGIVIYIILCTAVMKNVLIYKRTHIGEIRAIAIATITTGIFGAMTGHNVFVLEAGFWIMTLAGASYSVFLAHEQSSVSIEARQAEGLHL
jgi:hypothetical protein